MIVMATAWIVKTLHEGLFAQRAFRAVAYECRSAFVSLSLVSGILGKD
jgi:hypothetical protein